MTTRHASIAPALRAERNLPEDLIRLCVGIEDSEDLIDDLEAALLEAGAVRVVDEAGSRALLERVKTQSDRERDALLVGLEAMKVVDSESIIVSAPGKVILFGEHAVVHGIVSWCRLCLLEVLANLFLASDGNCWISRFEMLLPHRTSTR